MSKNSNKIRLLNIDKVKKVIVGELKKYKNIPFETRKKCSTEVADLIEAMYITKVSEEYETCDKWTHFVDPFLNMKKNKSNKAIVRCDDRDNFSIETGKELLTLKLNKRWHDEMAKKYSKLADLFAEALGSMTALCIEHEDESKILDEEIKKYN